MPVYDYSTPPKKPVVDGTAELLGDESRFPWVDLAATAKPPVKTDQITPDHDDEPEG